MDFFGAQDTARRKTWQLVALFTAAVLGLVALTNLLVGGVLGWMSSYGTAPSLEAAVRQVSLEHWVGISAAVVLIVAGASLFKYLSIRGGGRRIAELAGGTEINPDSSDPDERRFLNVVAEMAIASGIPVPPCYVIEDAAINAFAAGHNADDAVIGVTRGSLARLKRDELQGIVGHEFSHILHGDTGINLRLIALLHGILFIGLIGQTLLRGSRFRGSSRSSSNVMPMIVLGIGLALIGYIGTFFGNLIKAAVSRQREYLADAASVQFTRNPRGIAEALKKIGGLPIGSQLAGSHVGELSHLYFGQAVTLFMNSLMATHPPLPKRIRAIQPSWNGRFPTLEAPVATDAKDASDSSEAVASFAGSGASGPPGSAGASGPFGSADTIAVELDPDAVVRETGAPNANRVDEARGLIDGLGPGLLDATRNPWAARGLIYALLLSRDPSLRGEQLALIDRAAESGVPDEVRKLVAAIESRDAAECATLVSLAMPALKQLSEPQYRRFIDNCINLIKHDRSIDLVEWVMHRLLLKELTPHFERRRPPPVKYQHVEQVAAATSVMLSSLARHGHDDPESQRAAFDAATANAGIVAEFDPDPDPNFSRLNEALNVLRQLRPLEKPKLIKAATVCIQHDGLAAPREVALLLGIGATLDCPLPPGLARSGSGRRE